ncbi:MAG: hypothetical protein ACFB2Z_11085 [Maricaulaceae bacterium]
MFDGKAMTDHFIYNGEIERQNDLDFIDLVTREKSATTCVLYLVTPGGSPDAAYKIGRYLQGQYHHITVVVSGFCKSAGTLLATAANELAFTPYGELGPLDVQMAKEDKILSLESGLNIGEAFGALEDGAREAFFDLTFGLIARSGGIVALPTAAHAASEVVAGLYGPVFSRIDPEEVGSRSRAMRIGEDYCTRLDLRSKNLKQNALKRISRSYSSHSFVIDFLEAKLLFNRVREANETECRVIENLGALARYPDHQLTIQKLGTQDDTQGDSHESGDDAESEPKPEAAAKKHRTRRDADTANGRNSARAGET